MSKRKPVKIVCPECGSENITYRGYVYWNKQHQEFRVNEIDCDYEPYCNACDTEFYDPEPEEIPLTPEEVIRYGLMNFDEDTTV